MRTLGRAWLDLSSPPGQDVLRAMPKVRDGRLAGAGIQCRDDRLQLLWLDGRRAASSLSSAPRSRKAGLVNQGTGATWSALVERGLLTTRHAHTGFADARTGRPIMSLLVRLTTDGLPPRHHWMDM